jgi:uncharacterized protein YfaP (DUF2135 family)
LLAQTTGKPIHAPIAPPGTAKPLSLRAPIAPPPFIVSQGAERAIELKSLRLSTEISGGMAQTTVEMVFFNPNSRNLEGNLQFPLLDGQQISSFALDIDGKLRPAVPVEKAKGQQIFESIERRNVDPGLLEATQGNNFKLRIFPIPAKGVRTVRLQYTEALARQGKNWAFRLPLAYGERWQDFELDLALHDLNAAPQVSSTLRELAFAKSGKLYQAHFRKAGFAMKGEVNLLIPASIEPQVYTQQIGEETWFVAEVPVSNARTARQMPKQIGLLWDSSNSAKGRDIDAELLELDRYFKAVGNGEVHLTRLRDIAEDGGSFAIVNGNWSALRQALAKTVYDGASNLTSWHSEARIQEYLLVSDGLHNYGDSPFPTLAAHQRLYALSSAQVSDAARLAGWAEASGGKLAQVNPQKPGAASDSLTSEAVHLDQVSANGARDFEVESHEAQAGLLRIAGKLVAREAQLSLNLSKNGKPQTLKIAIDGKAASHPFAASLWAAYRLRQLQADYELHRAEIRRIGQQFGLATRETSLLVLDRLDDYVRYDVTPPAELAAAVEQLKQVAGNGKLQQRQKHMESVVTLFKQKIDWWNKDFPKTDPVKIAVAEKSVSADAAIGMAARAQSERTVSAPRPMPTMAAPPPAPVAMAMAAPKVAEESAAGNSAPGREIGISMKKWTSNAPYIARFKGASNEQLYAMYLDEKPGYLNSSAFYLDAADILLDKGQRALGLRVLSNLAEMDLENRALLRILGYRLLQAGAAHQAIPVFEKVARLAPEEPQSFRDLGLAFAADKQYQKALDQLNEVVERVWDGRFPEIETIVLAEMNAIIATSGEKLDLSRIDPRLVKNLPLDLRVIMTWDADNSDMDLWVTDPNGERCYYGHPLTYQGGRMSRDFTGGYGPEEYSLKIAKPGKYKIETNFYGNRQQVLAGATTLQVKLSSGFGTAKQKEQLLSLRLTDARETVFVGEFEVKP